MAFTIFPKGGKSKPDRKERELRAVEGPSTRTLAQTGPGTRTRLESETWVPESGVIEVVEEAFLSPSLENAALMFAHGNASAALAALRHAVETPEGKQTLVWLSLFDLLARSGQRAAFDELALRYVVEFERSAPAWDEWSSLSTNAQNQPDESAQVKGRMLLRGELSDTQAPVLLQLKTLAKQKPHELPARVDIDLGDLKGASDICGTLLAGVLAALRRKGLNIVFRGLNPAVNRLAAHIEEQKAAVPRGLWYLTLELMQWADRQRSFEDLAVEFAVTFGISPPSWEPLNTTQRATLASLKDEPEPTPSTESDDRIRWQGELRGAHEVQLKLIEPNKVATNPVLIDLSRVQRIDFVCAGSITNAIHKLMAQAIEVRLVNASPILQALLQLTGTPSHLFTKMAR